MAFGEPANTARHNLVEGKAANLARDDRVSVTIDDDTPQVYGPSIKRTNSSCRKL